MNEKTISHKRAIEAAKTIVSYCEQQNGCQNCIFREHKPDHWDCKIFAHYLRERITDVPYVLDAKKRNGGYLP
ncbi:MAG: hypothetical protein J5958_06745 [Clostridia bacterium]|nr:hypothetical protein [Clostridia bacterium]